MFEYHFRHYQNQKCEIKIVDSVMSLIVFSDYMRLQTNIMFYKVDLTIPYICFS